MDRWLKSSISILVGSFFFLGGNVTGNGAQVAFGKSTRKGRVFKQENTKANLVALMKEIQRAQKAGQVAKAAALTKGLFLNERRIKRGLKRGVSPTVVRKIAGLHKRYSSLPSKKLAGLLRSKDYQTVVKAHAATTKAMAANKRGTIVFKEFPGGAVRAAKQILRPNTIFYEVEYLKPGSKYGMKYHLFFWDGSRWAMLGPVWRALR